MDPKTADIVENVTYKSMFKQRDMDERGELPGPFCLEKHNFNPHLMSGDFEYQDGQPVVLKNEKGQHVDRNGRRVNQAGWYIDPHQAGALVDRDLRKKFDKRQLQAPKFNDLPKLFNYQGRRFDIRDVMGEFDKDPRGDIQVQVSPADGKTFLDNLGRPVNERGYLIDSFGNIVDKSGR